jgi:hypothetical protein
MISWVFGFQDTAPAFVVFARILVPRVGVEPHSSPTRMGYSGLELSNMYVSVRSYHGFVVNSLIARCMPAAVRERTTHARTYRALAGISRSTVDRDVALGALPRHFGWEQDVRATPWSLAVLIQRSQLDHWSRPLDRGHAWAHGGVCTRGREGTSTHAVLAASAALQLQALNSCPSVNGYYQLPIALTNQ